MAVVCSLMLFLAATAPALFARPWTLVGSSSPVEAEYIETHGDMVVLRGANGVQREFPLASFNPDDQAFIRAQAKPTSPSATTDPADGKNPTTATDNIHTVESLPNRIMTLRGTTQLHITGKSDPLPNSSINLASPDAWVFLDNIAPSTVASKFLNRFHVNGSPAMLNNNVRVVQYSSGAVVIPHRPDFEAMTVFSGPAFAGSSLPLKCFFKYNDASLGMMKTAIRSFRLKRGYMATIAEHDNGTGISKNYVAQDHDIEVTSLPSALDQNIRFIRIFPWRWVSKKGIAGDIWQNFNLGWYYNWNISKNSTLDLEYVPIRQNRWWPDLSKPDWKTIGTTTLLGYNEPDHKDQSNLTVDQAIAGWPDLLATGLRVGSPAVSDGGLNWLYQFIDKADAAKLRVDFVAVHYYRAYPKPSDPAGAAAQLQQFVKGIHDRTHRPIWITEFNNGANWTKAPKPTYEQEKTTIAKMIEMLDNTPYVERYAFYNWVEDVRNVQRKNGSLTPAGEVYRDNVSPSSYIQEVP